MWAGPPARLSARQLWIRTSVMVGKICGVNSIPADVSGAAGPCSMSRWWSSEGQKTVTTSCILSLGGANRGWLNSFFFGSSCSEYFCTWHAHNNHMHNVWPCFPCHIMFMQPALISPITSSLLSPHTLCLPLHSPAVKIYWVLSCLVYLVFLPRNSYCCFWVQEKTLAGHLIKSLGHWLWACLITSWQEEHWMSLCLKTASSCF